MKIVKTIAIAGFFLILLTSILIFILAKIYLTPETIRNSLSIEIEKQLMRDVSFNNIEIDLIKGITLYDVTIHKSFPWEKEDIVVCEKAHLNFRIAPLLLKKLLINKIVLNNTRINIQFADGHPFRIFGNVKNPMKKNGSLGIFFLPDSINSEKGELKFNDLSSNCSVTMTNVHASADHISLFFPSEFTLSANLEGDNKSAINCMGSFYLPRNELKADITTGNIPLDIFSGFLNARKIPMQKGYLTLETNITTDGLGSITFNGNAKLKDISLAIKTSPVSEDQLKLDGINTTLAFQSLFDLSRKLFTIKEIKGKFLFSQFSGKGTIGIRNNLIDLSLNSNKFYIDDVLNKIDEKHSLLIKGLKLAGDIGLKVDIKGSLDKPVFPVFTINLRDNRLLYSPLGSIQPKLKGDLIIDRDNISVAGLRIDTKNLSIKLSGDISDYRKWPPKSTLKIESSTVNIYNLFNPAESEIVEEIGPFNLEGLSFDGPIKLGSTSFLGMILKDVHGRYLFENNNFFIKDLQGNIDEGEVKLSATVDLGVKGLDYYLYLKLRDAPIKSIMSMFPGYYSGFIEGTISATCALKGNGTEPANIINNLKGDAFLYLNNANIKGLTFMPQLSSIIKSDKLQKISFQKANFQFKLRSGAVEVEGALISPMIELHPSGGIGLDSSLDLEANMKISPELFTGSTNLANYLPHEDGWVTLPVKIEGTLQKPIVSLDRDTLNYIIKETLPRLLMDMLGEAADNSTEGVSDNSSGAGG